MSYSIYLCLFVYSGGFFLFVFLLVSCVPNVSSLIWIVHFLIAPSVFSNVYFLPPVIFGKAFDHLSFHQL